MIEHKADCIVNVTHMKGYTDPNSRSRANPMTWIHSFRRLTGFGRTLSKTIDTQDVNNDGVVFVRIVAPGPWRAVLRNAKGEVVVRLNMEDTTSTDVQLRPGQHTIKFQEV